MGEHDKIPDPEDFTQQVEDTIDDLFNPSRKIEIDPLTNAIKEVSPPAGGEEVSAVDLPLSGEAEDQGPAALEVAGGASESSQDLDFDFDFAPPEAPGVAMPQGEGLEALCDQLYQALLTLEWEVTPQNVAASERQFDALWVGFAERQTDQSRRLLALMGKVWEGLVASPHKVPTYAITALKKGVETLSADVKQDGNAEEDLGTFYEQAQAELEKVLLELQAAKEPPAPPEPSGLTLDSDMLELSLEEPDALELEASEEPSADAPEGPPEAPEIAAETMLPPEAPAAGETPGPLPGLVVSHVGVLDACIAEVASMEHLFRSTKGMDKLARLHCGIKERLLSERRLLAGALEGFDVPEPPELPPPAPTIAKATAVEEPEEEPASALCPWSKLMGATWEGMEVAFDPDEIAFVGQPAWWNRGGLRAARVLEMKKLKAWPWSSLKGLVQGDLITWNEDRLRALELPVVHNPKPSVQRFGVPEETFVLVLYREGRGCAIFLDNPMKILSANEAWTWEKTKEDSDPWVGQIKLDHDEIPVATLDRLLKK